MKEIISIIKREYWIRLRSKSFLLGAFLTPIFFSFIIFAPTFFTQSQDDKKRTIGVVDQFGLIKHELKNTKYIIEDIGPKSTDEIKSLIEAQKYDGIINVINNDLIEKTSIQYYYQKSFDAVLVNQVELATEKKILNEKLKTYGIDDISIIISNIKHVSQIQSIEVESQNAKIVNNKYKRPLCFVLGLTIYILIFLFSSQVMQGVLEEKSNRIVELIITSVSPIKFMIGKIVGIALLGFTQIIIWVVVSYFIIFILSFDMTSLDSNFLINKQIDKEQIYSILNSLDQINFDIIVFSFIMFFITGYLLYSSMFAAIGAAGNNTEELQQLSLIITTPLILSIIILTSTVNEPNSSLSVLFSMIPFTSPIIMMARVVYGVPFYEVILSVIILLITILAVMWFSGKIYKTAILYTGKEMSLKNIILWFKQSKK